MARIKESTDKDGKPPYTVEIRIKGCQSQSATFKRLTDAKKWAQLTEAAIKEGRHFKTVEAKKHTVGEMIDRYLESADLTKVQDEHTGLHLRRWKDEIGYMLLSDVTADTITIIKDKLLSEVVRTGNKHSPTSVLRYIASLSTAFNMAIRNWGWIEDSPIAKIDKPKVAKGRVRFLDDDELERLTATCKASSNPMLYQAFALAIRTGMRQAETMNLYWNKAPNNPPDEAWGLVHLDQQCIILHKTKNGERRRVPIVGSVLSMLKDMAKVRRIDTPLLFPSHKDPLISIDIRYPWEKALEQANVVDFHWHDLRHCTASYLAMNGATLPEIAEVTGHKDLQMVKRYAHLSHSHIHNVLEDMNAKKFGN